MIDILSEKWRSRDGLPELIDSDSEPAILEADLWVHGREEREIRDRERALTKYVVELHNLTLEYGGLEEVRAELSARGRRDGRVDHREVAWRGEAEQAQEDLTTALDAIDEVMSHDKGMGEEDWVEFCHNLLPFMKSHGRRKYTEGWS